MFSGGPGCEILEVSKVCVSNCARSYFYVILVKSLYALCSCLENTPQGKLKGNELILFVKKIQDNMMLILQHNYY